MSQGVKIYLGIDWGEARIGLAIGDSENKIATPYGVALTYEEALKVIKEERIDKIVIGKPIKMQGDHLALQKEYLVFLDTLKKQAGIPIISVDERLTSKAADALKGDKKTKASRDAIAAMLILQSYFDRVK